MLSTTVYKKCTPHQHHHLTFTIDFNNMPKEFKMPTMELFQMAANLKRLREEQEAMDVDPVTHPSSPTLTSQSPHPTKRAGVARFDVSK